MTAELGTFYGVIALLALAAIWLLFSGARQIIANRRARRPFDWEVDAPEYRCAKDAHVRRID